MAIVGSSMAEMPGAGIAGASLSHYRGVLEEE